MSLPRYAIAYRFLLALVLTLSWAGTSHAQVTPLPDRPTRSAEAMELGEDFVRDLRRAWSRDRNPTVVIILGVQQGDRLVYNQQSTMIERIQNPLKTELRRAFTNGLIVPEIKDLQEKQVFNNLARAAGKPLTEDAQAVMQKQFEADILIDVTLLATQERGRFSVNMNAIDMRQGIEVASESMRTVPTDLDIGRGAIYGKAIAETFGKQYMMAIEQEQTYTIKLLSLRDRDGMTATKFTRLRRDVERLDDVVWAEESWVEGDEESFGELKVRFAGRLTDLVVDLSEISLPKQKFTATPQQVTRMDAVLFIHPAATPNWYRLTDADDPTYGDSTRKRLAKLAASGVPKLGVLVGSDIAEPIAQFTADADAADANFDDATLQGEIENQFREIGFSVVDADTLSRQLERSANNAQRYDNLPHLAEALKDIDGVDVILHVNVQRTADGEHAYNMRLFDVKRAAFIGFQRWPDAAANPLEQYRVRADRPEQVARYVTGQLLARWDRYAQQSHDTMTVQLRNAKDTQQVLAVIELLKGNLTQLDSIADLQVSSPVASLDLVFTGSRFDLTYSLIDAIVTRIPGATVEPLGDTTIINLGPVVLSEKEAAKRRKKLAKAQQVPIGNDADPKPQRPQPPDEQAPAPAPVPTPEPAPASPTVVVPGGNEGDRVAKVLREAKESVFVIVASSSVTKSTGSGTGWTVRPGLLATNAHVAVMVQEFREADPNATIVAFNDASREKALKLGRIWVHPKYKGPDAGSSWYDVAFIEVTAGDAGKPLTLATETELAQLNPPEAVGYVGFPSAGVAHSGIPFKQAHLGQLNAVIDFRLMPNTTATERVISHNLVSSGGASGSPIFDGNGRVIAIHNAGGVDVAEGSNGNAVRVNSDFKYGVFIDVLARYLAEVENDR